MNSSLVVEPRVCCRDDRSVAKSSSTPTVLASTVYVDSRSCGLTWRRRLSEVEHTASVTLTSLACPLECER
jgi:hypothetical protein